MRALVDGGLPVASSCLGDGICGKCKIRVTEGANHLSKANEVELVLAERFAFKSNERVSCQTRVEGDVTVDATYW